MSRGFRREPPIPVPARAKQPMFIKTTPRSALGVWLGRPAGAPATGRHFARSNPEAGRSGLLGSCPGGFAAAAASPVPWHRARFAVPPQRQLLRVDMQRPRNKPDRTYKLGCQWPASGAIATVLQRRWGHRRLHRPSEPLASSLGDRRGGSLIHNLNFTCCLCNRLLFVE